MRTRHLAVAFLLVFGTIYPLFGGRVAGAAEKVLLRPKFEKGTYIRMIMTTNMIVEMKIKGLEKPGDMKGRVRQIFELVYRVVDVAKDGAITLEMAYDRIQQTMNMGGMKMEFDSKNTDENKLNPQTKRYLDAIAPLLNVKLVVTLDKNLRAKDVKGFDAYWEELGKTPAGKGPLLAQMKKMFGDQQLKQLVDQYFTRYMPPGPVGVGESWETTDDLTVPVIGQVKVDMQNKLLSVGDHKGKRCAKVEIKFQMETTDTQPIKALSQVGQVKLSECEGRGHYWFDLADSQVAEMEVDQIMHMSMRMKGRPGAAAGKAGAQMEQRMRMKIHMISKPEPTTQPKATSAPKP